MKTKPPELSKSTAATAIVLTVVCAILGFGMVWISTGATGTGGSGMWIVFPIIAVVGAHIFMGPAAIFLALLSRRWLVNIFVFSYFIGGIWSIWIMMTGHSPVQIAKTNITEMWSAFADARRHPAETELCEALAIRLRIGGRDFVDATPLSLAQGTQLDPDFLCRHRRERLPRHLRNFYRSTPIQLAAVGLEIDLINALIARGAAIDEPVNEAFTPLLLAVSNASHFSVHGSMGQQPHTERIRMAARALLEGGAAVNIRGAYGAGVLHWAAGTGDPGLVQLFLDAGAEVNAGKETGAGTPATASIETAHELMIRLERYKNITAAEYDPWYAGQQAILEILIQAGADPEDIVAAAVHEDGMWAIELLMHSGANISESIARHGSSHLQHAMRNNYRELATYLIELGVDVNQPTEREGRLITEFLMQQHEWQPALLLNAGADPNTVNASGETAIEIAVRTNNVNAIDLLLKAGAIVTSKTMDKVTTPEIKLLLESATPPA